MPRRKIAAGLLLAGSLLVATQTSAQAFTAAQVHKDVTVTGAGATFPLNAIDQWKADFKKKTGATINYTGVGSGAGRSQFINGTVDFGSSDVRANADETNRMNRKHGGFTYVISTAGAIAVTYNVKGVPGGLKLTANDIAKIFSGKIRYWDDEVIADDNPSVKLPHTPVQVIVRSDSSGTSSAFTDYLTAAAGRDWEYGSQSRFPTNRQQIGKSGNDGVANGVKAADGAVGYVEVSFAKERGLAMAMVKNEAGGFAFADGAPAVKALDQGKLRSDGSADMGYTSSAPGIYPITTVSYFLVPLKWKDAKKLANFKEFMAYVLSDGQKKATKLNYIPLTRKYVDAAKKNLARLSVK